MVRRYSQRMLNPYHGLVNVVEIPGADAVTRDGVNWVLYLQGGSEMERLDDGSLAEVLLPDIKFGVWDARHGLKRAPVRYVTDYAHLDALGSQLLEQVKRSAPHLPFPQADVYECWLLHAQEGRPLALLHSVCDLQQLRQAEVNPVWNPGHRARQGFNPGYAPEAGQAGANAAQQLARQINRAAGDRPRLLWCLRDQHGDARVLDPDGTGTGQGLSRAELPELLLSQHWGQAAEERLVQAYIAWQAPWLLALQDVARDTRRRLEALASKRPMLTADLCHTYPLILDRKRLAAVRVQAAMRRAQELPHEADETLDGDFFLTGN